MKMTGKKQNKDRHTHRSTVHRYGAAAENTVGRRKLFPDIQGKASLQIPVAGWWDVSADGGTQLSI